MTEKTSGPLVSVIVPLYNHEGYIVDAIKSIIEQTYKMVELIIIDDGSTDSSVNAVESVRGFCQKRFHRFEFRSRPNKGLCATINEALEWCKGEYVSIIASDDLMCRDKTALQVSFLEANPQSAAVFSGVEIIHADGEREAIMPTPRRVYGFGDILLHRHFLPAATQMARLEALKETGGYLDGIILEDWYMLLKLAETGKTLDSIEGVVCLYRKHGANISSNITKMNEGRAQVLDLYRDHPLYQRACSNAFVAASSEIGPDSLRSGVNYLWKAFVTYPLVVLQPRFVRQAVRLFFPVFFKGY